MLTALLAPSTAWLALDSATSPCRTAPTRTQRSHSRGAEGLMQTHGQRRLAALQAPARDLTLVEQPSGGFTGTPRCISPRYHPEGALGHQVWPLHSPRHLTGTKTSSLPSDQLSLPQQVPTATHPVLLSLGVMALPRPPPWH